MSVIVSILVPRAYDPSGLRQESRALGACVLHVVIYHKEKHLTFVYITVCEMYRLPNLIKLRMHLEQITFVLKRIVPLG